MQMYSFVILIRRTPPLRPPYPRGKGPLSLESRTPTLILYFRPGWSTLSAVCWIGKSFDYAQPQVVEPSTSRMNAEQPIHALRLLN